MYSNYYPGRGHNCTRISYGARQLIQDDQRLLTSLRLFTLDSTQPVCIYASTFIIFVLQIHFHPTRNPTRNFKNYTWLSLVQFLKLLVQLFPKPDSNVWFPIPIFYLMSTIMSNLSNLYNLSRHNIFHFRLDKFDIIGLIRHIWFQIIH